MSFIGSNVNQGRDIFKIKDEIFLQLRKWVLTKKLI